MHAAAWALSRRQRGGTWACLYVGGDGLPDCSALSLLGFAFESGGLSRAARVCGPAVLRSCGPVVLRPCACGLCCHAVSDVCARPGTAPHHLLAAATREVRGGAGGAGFSLCSSVAGGAGGLGALANETGGKAHPPKTKDELARRWRSGRPGRGALVALSSWPVAVRRRALGAVPPVLVALGAAWLGVACGVASAGFGCRGPKKRRRADTEDEDTRGRPAAGSATWRHVLVRLHTRFVRCVLLEHKPHELPELTS